MTSSTYYTDFPTKPIGRGNPYHKCAHCGISVPEINGRLDRHGSWCAYRMQKQLEGYKDKDDN